MHTVRAGTAPAATRSLGVAVLVMTSALAFSGTALGQSARAASQKQPPLHAQSWGSVDLAFDRAERTSGLVGTRCMPQGRPGSTLLMNSERLKGIQLKRSATRARQSREFVALDRALKARGFRALRSQPYGRAAPREKLIVVPYTDARGRGAYAGLLQGKGMRRAEARFTNPDGGDLQINRSTLVVDPNAGEGSSLTARAAGLDLLCLGICLQTRIGRCARGAAGCVRFVSIPFIGTAAFLTCAAAVCGPETLMCIRKCL